MRNLLTAGALALVCLCLSGCGLFGSSTPPSAPKLTGNLFVDFAPAITKLQTVTQADVQGALADAKAQKDAVGELCWQTVLDNLPALQSQQQAKAAGLATGLQLGRDLQANIPRIADACQAVLPTGLASIAGGL